MIVCSQLIYAFFVGVFTQTFDPNGSKYSSLAFSVDEPDVDRELKSSSSTEQLWVIAIADSILLRADGGVFLRIKSQALSVNNISYQKPHLPLNEFVLQLDVAVDLEQKYDRDYVEKIHYADDVGVHELRHYGRDPR